LFLYLWNEEQNIDGSLISVMQEADFEKLFTKSFGLVLQFRVVINKIKESLDKISFGNLVINESADSPTTSGQSLGVETHEELPIEKENRPNEPFEKEWPKDFVFPKQKVSKSLEFILSQPDLPLDQNQLKNFSVFNELINLVFDEIIALNM
jgi:hypothetical protein